MCTGAAGCVFVAPDQVGWAVNFAIGTYIFLSEIVFDVGKKNILNDTTHNLKITSSRVRICLHKRDYLYCINGFVFIHRPQTFSICGSLVNVTIGFQKE